MYFLLENLPFYQRADFFLLSPKLTIIRVLELPWFFVAAFLPLVSFAIENHSSQIILCPVK